MQSYKNDENYATRYQAIFGKKEKSSRKISKLMTQNCTKTMS